MEIEGNHKLNKVESGDAADAFNVKFNNKQHTSASVSISFDISSQIVQKKVQFNWKSNV